MKAFTLLILTGVLTACIIMAGKVARIEGVQPLSILLWQISGSGLILWCVLLVTRGEAQIESKYFNWQHIRYYLIGGLLANSLPFVLIYTVVMTLPVGLVGLITALSPLMTYALSRFFRQEPSDILRLIGIVFGLSGVAFLMLSKDTTTDTNQWPYLLMALAIPLTLSLSNLYRSISWPEGSEALPLATGMLTVQGVLLLPFAGFSDTFQQIQFYNASVNLLAVGLMLLAGFSYFGSFVLLRMAGPVYLSQMGYVITVISVFLGIIFFDEQYRGEHWVAMILIFIGLLLVSYQSFTSVANSKNLLRNNT